MLRVRRDIVRDGSAYFICRSHHHNQSVKTPKTSPPLDYLRCSRCWCASRSFFRDRFAPSTRSSGSNPALDEGRQCHHSTLLVLVSRQSTRRLVRTGRSGRLTVDLIAVVGNVLSFVQPCIVLLHLTDAIFLRAYFLSDPRYVVRA